ncbi:hypothetical protein [Mesorhizobium sp. L103C105A0]|nr:hypothetical protein [Mesorhizobium sp. L103C105A0]
MLYPFDLEAGWPWNKGNDFASVRQKREIGFAADQMKASGLG